MTLFERVKELADKQGKSINDIENDLKYSQNTLYRLKRTNPSSKKLEELADYFHVSTDYLLGRNDTPEWATEKDTHDLEEFLEQNEGSMTYGGEKLTEEDKEKLKIAMTQIFWRRHKHD